MSNSWRNESIPNQPGRGTASARFFGALLVLAVLIQTVPLALSPQLASAFSNSWTFASSADYTFDNTKIKFTGGQTQLGRTPDWWDTSYLYRKRITVTAGSTAVTTSHTLTLKTDVAALVSASKVQADFDDLRVVYWNGSTNANIDRDYRANGLDAVLDSGTDQNDIRFKAQAAISASGSDAGYYLYYGNSGATAGPQNPANVYEYYEPFSADPSWYELNSARWSWSSGLGRLSHDTTNTVNERAAKSSGSFDTTKSWNFEVTAQRTSATNVTGFGLSNMSANDVEPSLGWRMTTSPSADVELWKDGAAGSWIDNTGVGTATITQNTDYTFTIRHIYSGDPTCDADWATGSAWVDGVKYNEAGVGRDNLNASNCPATVNPTAYNFNATATFDDVKGWEYLGESNALASEEVTYPTDDPTVTPTAAVSFTTLTSFSETSTLNGGVIRYALSNNGGTSWVYHNGTSWVTSDASYAQSTTAANINTNVSTFPTGSGSFLFRAFLHSSGSQLVQLDTVTINGNRAPATPTLSTPADAATVTAIRPVLTLTTTDDESDTLQYKIQLDTANTFATANLQTFDQTSSQTGWSGQTQSSSTRYASGGTATYTLQANLTPSTTYYWRGAAIDPAGSNTFSGYSSARSFTTPSVFTISAITATASGSDVIITWTTSRDATTTVEYGTTTSYGTTSTVSGSRSSHTVTLTSLTASTTYHYRVSGTDSTGQTVTSSDQTFVSSVPTTVSSVVATPISSQSVIVTWTSNNAATSTVEYGTSTSYGATATSSTLVTSHSVTITSLTPATQYHFRVSSTGASTTATSSDSTFTMPLPVPTIISPSAGEAFASSQTIKVIGLAQAGATITIYVDGTADGTTTVRDTSTVTGDFAYTLQGSLTVGSHSISAKSTVNGIDSLVGDARSITISGAAIAPTILDPLVVNADNPRITIRGLAPSGSSIVVSLDGKKIKTVTATNAASGTGSFAATILTKGLSIGKHTVTVVGLADDGRPSNSRTAAVFTIGKNGHVTTRFKTAVRTIVVGGESLWALAEQFYGNGRLYTKIVNANKVQFPSLVTNPSLIRAGWRLVIPK